MYQLKCELPIEDDSDEDREKRNVKLFYCCVNRVCWLVGDVIIYIQTYTLGSEIAAKQGKSRIVFFIENQTPLVNRTSLQTELFTLSEAPTVFGGSTVF